MAAGPTLSVNFLTFITNNTRCAFFDRGLQYLAERHLADTKSPGDEMEIAIAFAAGMFLTLVALALEDWTRQNGWRKARLSREPESQPEKVALFARPNRPEVMQRARGTYIRR